MAHTSLPPLDLIGPDGDRITLRSLDRDDTVGALAERLGTDTLWAAGRILSGSERLAEIDELRIGARLGAGPGPASSLARPPFDARSGPDSRAVVEVAVVSGPAASNWVPLPAGRHLVGRAGHARVCLDDPAVELHHALLIVGDGVEPDDGSNRSSGSAAVDDAPGESACDTDDRGWVEIVQLSGAVPIRIDGRVLESGVRIDVGDRVTIGSSTMQFRRPCGRPGPGVEHGSQGLVADALRPVGTIAAHPSDPWRRIVRRAPFQQLAWAPTQVVAPLAMKDPARPALTGLIGVAVTGTGAVVIAQVMGNPMFMLFAAMGVIASLATFAVGTITARRKRSTLRAEHGEQIEVFRCAVEQLHLARVVHHAATHRSIVATLDEVIGGGTRIWQRRIEAGDAAALRAVIGTGTARWRPDIDVRDHAALEPALLQRAEASARLVGVPAPISIRAGDAIALHGSSPLARSVARAVIAQLATWVGPADWQLVVVSSDARAWRWVDWLPHGALDGAALVDVGGVRVDGLGDALDAVDPARTTLLVTDEPRLFTARTGALRRFLSASGAAAIVVVDTEATVPAMCHRVLTVGSTGSATWTGEVPDDDDAVAIEFAGISLDTADEIARSLACLVDPEDDGGSGGGVPNTVSFGELMPAAETSPDVIAERWRDGGPDPAPSAPLGWSVDGRVDIDLVRDGPHGLIAGTTGAGKSELLRTLVLSMAASVGPQHLNFVLVDYKGGSTFDACTALPHAVGLVTDLDDGLAERALVSLEAELHRRERMLRAVGASDLTDYRGRRDACGTPLDPIARLLVVIDEFAALAKELPDFLNALVGIAQRGRSLGVHLLLATQRPAGVVNDDIRANTNLRLALRLHDRPDAMDVVGDELPSRFPRGLPGRAALRLGPDELVVFQAARCTGPSVGEDARGMIVDRPARPPEGARRHRGVWEAPIDRERSELEVTAEAIVAAAAIDGVDAPHRPWVEPLPFPLQFADEDVEADAVGAVVLGESQSAVIGMIDDPEHQRRVPLVWKPGDGSLALVGSIGSGTTWTLISLATASCRSTSPDRLHLYVIDARGDDALGSLASVAHCGGVVRVTEDERLHRLLRRVVDVIDERMTADADAGPDIVVMIDGYASVRTALGAVERQATFDLLQRVVNDGPAARVDVVIADDATSAMTMAPVANRWFFHLDDPSAARGLGLRAAPVAHGRPGRCRILACGREAQVAQGAVGLAALPGHGDADGGPEPIVALPDTVGADMIGSPAVDSDTGSVRRVGAATGDVQMFAVSPDVVPERSGRVVLAVGLSSTDLGVATLDVAAGDHVLIAGAPRTGVSTAVARCAAAWAADARRRGEPFDVIHVDRRTTLDSEAIADPGVRVCVVADDAHRVDDAGLLTSIAKGDHPHVTVIAGGRADAIRSAYGHWTREIARARCGMVMTSRNDPDGDVLGVQVPRRALIPARAGLAWLVDAHPLRLAQIATD